MQDQRRITRWTGGLAGLLIAASLPAKAAVFGADDRVKLARDPHHLANKIGTLTSTRTGAMCSAFCVAPDMIATARHCLFGTPQIAAPDTSSLVFATDAAPDAATRLAGSGPSPNRSSIVAGTRRLSLTPPIDAAEDWAIARLARPMCRDGGLPISALTGDTIEVAARDGKIYQVGAHRDLSDTRLRRDDRCALVHPFASDPDGALARDFVDWRAILFHRCDTGAGSSGSPLLIDGKDGPEVIGINVGTYVISRAIPSAATGDAQAPATVNEPVANTAISSSRFLAAISQLRRSVEGK